MKVSELIKILQDIINAHGDLDINSRSYDSDFVLVVEDENNIDDYIEIDIS